MVRFTLRGRLLAMATVGICALAASSAYGQTSATGATAVGEVIVTAQKRQEKLQNVPISMTVVQGKQIAAFRETDLFSVADRIPNLYVERLNGGDVIYIRGFGSPPGNFDFDQSVSLYEDGIYAGRNKQFEAPFFDLERVEVLRGPQGALFGKNTPAGAISIVTAGPTDTLQGEVTTSYNFELKGVEASGFLSGPITDKLSGRIAVEVLKSDGWVPDVTSGQDDPRQALGLVRLSLRYEPTTALDFMLKVEHSHVRNDGLNQVLASLTVPNQVTTDRSSDPDPFGHPERETIDANTVSLTGNWRLGGFTLTSVSGYSGFDANRYNSYAADVPAVFTNGYIEHFNQYSQELRLLSPSDQRFSYIVGAYFDHSVYDLEATYIYDLPIIPGGFPGNMYSVFHQSADTYSVFGQGTLHLTDRLRAIGSVRYTQTDKSANYDTVLVSGFPVGAVTTAQGSLAEGIPDGSATIQYDVLPHAMLYATYGHGSKSGGFVSNTLGVVDSTFQFKAEESQNYEVGVKSAWFDGRLVADVSIYDTRFNDLQLTIFDPNLPGFVTGNAAAASSRGVESSLIWQPARSLKLSWEGAYQDAKYDNYPGATCLARQPLSVCDPSAPSSAPNSTANNNLAGYPLTFASKWSGNVQAEYTTNLAENYRLVATGVVAYRSKFFISDDQSLVYGVQPAYAKIDGRLALYAPDNRWHLALIGKNLTDVTTYTFANAWPAYLTHNATALKYEAEPRTVTIEFGLKF